MFDYVVVADDYTGAVETAAKFMNGGYRAAVTLDPGSLGSLRKHSVVALDTETFFDSPERAGSKLKNIARDLMPWKDSTVFFKRIEPGLRGNVGPEVAVIARELGFETIVVASAFSRSRKAIEEGTVYLDKQERMSALTVTTSQSASSAATAALLTQAGMEPREVLCDAVRAGKTTEIVSKKGCYCFDAENDEDLRMIVRGVLKAQPAKDVLWVGSVGLAEALATAPKPFVFVIGTAHPRSVRQARQLLENKFVQAVRLSAAGLGTGQAAEARLRAADEAEPLLRCGQSILLIATGEDKRFLRGEYPNGDINGFMDLMADTVREIIGRTKIGGLCVTGGDCAVRIARRAKAENITLEREIQEGITLLSLSGGPFDGLPLISKSGSLGGERALVHCMEYFLHRDENPDTLPWM